jgi:hypothetical protein
MEPYEPLWPTVLLVVVVALLVLVATCVGVLALVL